MKELIALPLIATMLLGIVIQLESIAQSTADKAITFSDDMNKAMDCATRAIPIKECSPNLFEEDFVEETKQFKETLETIPQPA